MEREIPDVFNIFALGNPTQLDKRRGGVALPGLSSGRDDHAYRWSPRYEEQLTKWRDRSCPGERPRTYDRFYQKLPGNFKESGTLQQEPGTDSAISVCSSEESELTTGGKKKRKTKRAARSDLHYSRTLTEHDVRHLERHLSMKRTIRKTMMRDLQQAFVQDPKEFTKATRRRDININSLNFDRKTGTGQSEPNFLDMLRDSDDSGNGSPSRNPELKFRSCRERRRRPVTVAERDLTAIHNIHLSEPDPDYNKEDEKGKGAEKGGKQKEKEKKDKKKSFWQIITGTNKSKKEK